MTLRTFAQQIGQTGEALARQFLTDKGYRFLAANWRCKLGEIDLIMQDGPCRVLIEVRTRRSTTFGSGYETVAWQKQEKLRRAARVYQQQSQYWGEVRFDVVSITIHKATSPLIEHIPHAF